VLDEMPDVGSVVVPIGGGGLISGVATAIKALRPQTRVIGVQAERAAAVPASLEAGHPVSVPVGDTIADGIAVAQPGEMTFAHIAALVDEVVTVSDDAMARAVLLLAERAKQVVEPSGAAGLAALLSGAMTAVDPVVVLLAGGNVDPLLLARIIQSGLVSEGRHLYLRTRLLDRPGALVALLGQVADAGANVVAIEHHRMMRALAVLEVELQLAVETRGTEHSAEVVERLRAAGYHVELLSGP
jgi:threonine dehydratase